MRSSADRDAEDRDAQAERREQASTANLSPTWNDKSLTVDERQIPRVQHEAATQNWAANDRHHAAHDRRLAARDRDDAARERFSAARDDLTGVLRRGTGMLELQRDIDRSRRCGDPLVVAFLDVDDLKHTNDEHGHMAGDTALRTVAQALQTQMRSYDVIMRYGGDEFVCAQPGLAMTEAYERLLRVRARLSTAPRPVFVTFGLAELQPDDDLETLVARADAALYMTRSRRN